MKSEKWSSSRTRGLKNKARAQKTSVQKSICEQKRILVREHFCSTYTNGVLLVQINCKCLTLPCQVDFSDFGDRGDGLNSD